MSIIWKQITFFSSIWILGILLQASNHLPLFELKHIPLEFVQIQNSYLIPNAPLILYIQDPHSNPSGQYHIAQFLEKILPNYSIRLILVEGASSVVTLDELKKALPNEKWQSHAKQLLDQSQIHGEEYFNLTHIDPIEIIGIENSLLYNTALESYTHIWQNRDFALSYLTQIQNGLNILKEQYYPDELLLFEAFKKENQLQEVQMNEFIQLLSWIQPDLQQAPYLRKFLDFEKKSHHIDFKKAIVEQVQLIETISQHTPPGYLSQRLSQIMKDSQSQQEQFTYIKSILAVADEQNISIADFPTLQAYHHYLEEFSKLNFKSILKEMETLEEYIYKKTLTSITAQTIHAIDRYLHLLKTGFLLKLTAEEYEILKTNQVDFPIPSITNFINLHLAQLGRAEALTSYQPLIENEMPYLEKFYDTSFQRDFSFIDNIKKLLQIKKDEIIVLITGGYHTPHLLQEFQKLNWSYIVLNPIVTTPTSSEHYENILLGKNHTDTIRPHSLLEDIDRLHRIAQSLNISPEILQNVERWYREKELNLINQKFISATLGNYSPGYEIQFIREKIFRLSQRELALKIESSPISGITVDNNLLSSIERGRNKKPEIAQPILQHVQALATLQSIVALKTIRNIFSLSTYDMGVLLNPADPYSIQTISDWENGNTPIPYAVIDHAYALLDQHGGHLLTLTQEEMRYKTLEQFRDALEVDVTPDAISKWKESIVPIAILEKCTTLRGRNYENLPNKGKYYQKLTHILFPHQHLQFIRKHLNNLNSEQFSVLLRPEDPIDKATILDWESGKIPIPEWVISKAQELLAMHAFLSKSVKALKLQGRSRDAIFRLFFDFFLNKSIFEEFTLINLETTSTFGELISYIRNKLFGADIKNFAAWLETTPATLKKMEAKKISGKIRRSYLLKAQILYTAYASEQFLFYFKQMGLTDQQILLNFPDLSEETLQGYLSKEKAIPYEVFLKMKQFYDAHKTTIFRLLLNELEFSAQHLKDELQLSAPLNSIYVWLETGNFPDDILPKLWELLKTKSTHHLFIQQQKRIVQLIIPHKKMAYIRHLINRDESEFASLFRPRLNADLIKKYESQASSIPQAVQDQIDAIYNESSSVALNYYRQTLDMNQTQLGAWLKPQLDHPSQFISRLESEDSVPYAVLEEVHNRCLFVISEKLKDLCNLDPVEDEAKVIAFFQTEFQITASAEQIQKWLYGEILPPLPIINKIKAITAQPSKDAFQRSNQRLVEILEKIRQALNLTYEETGALATPAVSASTINNWLHGNTPVDPYKFSIIKYNAIYQAGPILKSIRQQLGLTEEQMGYVLNPKNPVHSSSIRPWEQGYAFLDWEILIKAQNILASHNRTILRWVTDATKISSLTISQTLSRSLGSEIPQGTFRGYLYTPTAFVPPDVLQGVWNIFLAQHNETCPIWFSEMVITEIVPLRKLQSLQAFLRITDEELRLLIPEAHRPNRSEWIDYMNGTKNIPNHLTQILDEILTQKSLEIFDFYLSELKKLGITKKFFMKNILGVSIDMIVYWHKTSKIPLDVLYKTAYFLNQQLDLKYSFSKNAATIRPLSLLPKGIRLPSSRVQYWSLTTRDIKFYLHPYGVPIAEYLVHSPERALVMLLEKSALELAA